MQVTLLFFHSLFVKFFVNELYVPTLVPEKTLFKQPLMLGFSNLISQEFKTIG